MNRLKENAVKAATFITEHACADAHLLLKSAADGVIKLESSIMHRLTGEAKSAIKHDRQMATADTQQQFNDAFNSLKQKLSEGMAGTHRTTMELIHDVSMFKQHDDVQ